MTGTSNPVVSTKPFLDKVGDTKGYLMGDLERWASHEAAFRGASGASLTG